MKKKIKLDKEEKELLKSFEKGEWKSAENLQAEIKKAQTSAGHTFRKDKRVNIRISTKDMEDIRRKAVEEGIPYQTLMSSVLHKYASGRLRGKSS